MRFSHANMVVLDGIYSNLRAMETCIAPNETNRVRKQSQEGRAFVRQQQQLPQPLFSCCQTKSRKVILYSLLSLALTSCFVVRTIKRIRSCNITCTQNERQRYGSQRPSRSIANNNYGVEQETLRSEEVVSCCSLGLGYCRRQLCHLP